MSWTGKNGRPHEARVRPCPTCDGTGLVARPRAEVTAEMIALRRAGLSTRELMRRYGITRQALNQRLRNGGFDGD